MSVPSDFALLEMVEQYKLDIEAPFFNDDEWTIFKITNDRLIDVSNDRSLRVALLKAYVKLNNENDNSRKN